MSVHGLLGALLRDVEAIDGAAGYVIVRVDENGGALDLANHLVRDGALGLRGGEDSSQQDE